MKVLEKNVISVVIVLVAAYNLYTQPLGTALTGLGLAAIVFATSNSLLAALAVLVVCVFVKDLNRMLSPKREPMGVESFQVKDPVSVQARLETIKVVAPKIQTVTGVLESASILDSTPLHGMDELANEGVPGASIPASAMARVLIYPPAETTIPTPSESVALMPKDNPYLQTGQDRLAQEVAMAQKGTELYAEDSASMAGVGSGAGPAF